MKILLTLVILLAMHNLQAQTKTLHDFNVLNIEGDEISLNQYAGKKVMVVNTASKCGLTPQYSDLQKLYEEFGGENFVILGFPANNFLKQEPGTNEEIAAFCQSNYGVSFPMMAKISVKGEDQHPLYRWLTSKAENGVEDSEVSWNFQKYLIDEKGNLVKVLSPKTSPYDDEILSWLKG